MYKEVFRHDVKNSNTKLFTLCTFGRAKLSDASQIKKSRKMGIIKVDYGSKGLISAVSLKTKTHFANHVLLINAEYEI